MIGPSVSAGKNVSAPTIRMEPTSSTVKVAPEAGKLPGPMATGFLRARLPASASSFFLTLRKRKSNIDEVEMQQPLRSRTTPHLPEEHPWHPLLPKNRRAWSTPA